MCACSGTQLSAVAVNGMVKLLESFFDQLLKTAQSVRHKLTDRQVRSIYTYIFFTFNWVFNVHVFCFRCLEHYNCGGCAGVDGRFNGPRLKIIPGAFANPQPSWFSLCCFWSACLLQTLALTCD